MFSGVELELHDLFLLETFQIAYLPGWIPEKEFACVIEHNPEIAVFLEKKYPPIASFISRVKEENASYVPDKPSRESTDRLLWTIADMLVYGKCPEVYDSLDFHNWDFGEITSITPLDRLTVIDAGSGTGRVAFEAAETASSVYAVEPVARLRQFIREKASRQNKNNIHAADGFLHCIPFPDSFADVLITSHALGWKLDRELREFERVVRNGGYIIHCPGTSVGDNSGSTREVLLSPEWGYSFKVYSEAGGDKRKYWKKLSSVSCSASEKEI